MKEEVERIKKLVGIDHNNKCKNMCKVPCIGTPKDIEAIIDAGKGKVYFDINGRGTFAC